MTIGTAKLFKPYKLGAMTLNHRVIMSPLTRYKSTRLAHVPILSLMKPYYAQRSSTPGTLIVTEATFIAAKAGGYGNIPGIWSEEQITHWKQITDAVHANGSYIVCQLWALGRAASPEELQEEDPSFPYVSASPITLAYRGGVPRELTITEIKEYVELYVQAAKNAIAAGFDGVEIHNANGYLLDQFVKDVSNQRTDEYGGSIENRSKFTFEVVRAVVDAIGGQKTGIRFSPWGVFQEMKVENPIPQFTYLVSELKERFPDLLYMHLVEPKDSGPEYSDKSNDFLRKIWSPKPLITAGGYERDSAIKTGEENDELIAFGQLFLANPDLPVRLEKNLPLNTPNPKTFYTRGDQPTASIGYIDYPFIGEVQATHN